MKKIICIIGLFLCSCSNTREEYKIIEVEKVWKIDYVVQHIGDTTYFYKVIEMMDRIPVIDSTYEYKRRKTPCNTTDTDIY